MLDRMQRLRRGASTGVGIAATALSRSRAVAAKRAATTTTRTRCARLVRPRTDPRPVHAVLLDRGRRRGRRRRRDDLRGLALPGEAGRRAQPGADARQHRARGLLDDHPVPDPRGDGRVHDRRRSSTSPKIPNGHDVVHINVTGRQWFWEYEYTDRHELLHRQRDAHPGQPADACSRSRSDNVIHSFWVPELTARRTSCPATRTRSRSRPTSPARSSGSAPSTAACRTPTCGCG